MATPIDPIDEGPLERQQFFRRLLDFHRDRGTPIPKMPVLGKREVDLFELYERVKARGGIREVVINRKWPEIVKLMPLPKTCTNAGFSLKLLYQRYLLDYERVFVHHQPDIPPAANAPRNSMPIPDYLPENVALPDPFLGAERDGNEEGGAAAPVAERTRKRGRSDANGEDGMRRVSSNMSLSAAAVGAGATAVAVASVGAAAPAEDPLLMDGGEEERLPEVVLHNLAAVTKRLELSLASPSDSDVDWALCVLLVQTHKKIPVFSASRALLDRFADLLLHSHEKAGPLEHLMGFIFNPLSFPGAARRERLATILANAVAVEENIRAMAEHSQFVSALLTNLANVPYDCDPNLPTRFDLFVVLDAVVARGISLTPQSAEIAVRSKKKEEKFFPWLFF